MRNTAITHPTHSTTDLALRLMNKAHQRRDMNHQKLKNAELVHGQQYDLGNNISVAFWAARGSIRKVYYWGQREITKETALRRAGIMEVV